MARKVKIMENEKHPIDDLKNDEITKKREKWEIHTEGPGIWQENYHKKRVQREHQNKGGTKEKAENKTFTEETFTGETGNSFQGEGGSEFAGSKKLKKKQRQAQKAGRKVQKARAKLPKTREYTLQRVFDEKTGKGKYVAVPLDKEKPFKQEGVSKTTMRRVQNEGKP